MLLVGQVMGVTHLQVGDPVVIAYRAPCEQCPACRRGDPRRCYMALRPQIMADVRRGNEVITCDNCNRILYYEPENASQPAHVS